MRVEIDQSGRIEYTSVPTSIGDSLGNCISISARNKQQLQRIYRNFGKPRVFVLEVFALLVVLTIKQSFKSENIYIIDEEYTGRFDEIKNSIKRYSHIVGLKIDTRKIHLRRIGKYSKAHETAYKGFKNNIRKKIVNTKDILKIILTP